MIFFFSSFLNIVSFIVIIMDSWSDFLLDLSSASDFVISFLSCKIPSLSCNSLQRRCKFAEAWTAKPLWKQVNGVWNLIPIWKKKKKKKKELSVSVIGTLKARNSECFWVHIWSATMLLSFLVLTVSLSLSLTHTRRQGADRLARSVSYRVNGSDLFHTLNGFLSFVAFYLCCLFLSLN